MGTPISVKLRRINVYNNGIRQRHPKANDGRKLYFDPQGWEDAITASPERQAKRVELMGLYYDKYGEIATRLNYLSPWPPSEMPYQYRLQAITDSLKKVWESQGFKDLESTILAATDDHENIFLPANAGAGDITTRSKPSWLLLNVATAMASPRAGAEVWTATEDGVLVRIDVTAPTRLAQILVAGAVVGTVNLQSKTYPLGGEVWVDGFQTKLTGLFIQILLWGACAKVEQVGTHIQEWTSPDHRLNQSAVAEYMRRTCGRILWQMAWLEKVMGLEKVKQESLGGKGGLLGKPKGHTQPNRRNAPLWYKPNVKIPPGSDEPLWVFTIRTLKQVNEINDWIDGLFAMLFP